VRVCECVYERVCACERVCVCECVCLVKEAILIEVIYSHYRTRC
jgi:hypothetical protein